MGRWAGSDLRSVLAQSLDEKVTRRLGTFFAALYFTDEEVGYVFHRFVSLSHAAGGIEETFIVARGVLQREIEEVKVQDDEQPVWQLRILCVHFYIVLG